MYHITFLEGEFPGGGVRKVKATVPLNRMSKVRGYQIVRDVRLYILLNFFVVDNDIRSYINLQDKDSETIEGLQHLDRSENFPVLEEGLQSPMVRTCVLYF